MIPAEDRVRLEPEERVAPDPSLLGRFEQEAGTVADPGNGAKLEEGRDGGLAVVDEAVDDRRDCHGGAAASDGGH